MKTIRLEPLTRVEGHGRVELSVRGGRLAAVKVSLLESPRLFEGLVLGRYFNEVPALVCRICAICSSVHRIAAAGALEKALGVTIPAAARLVRELLLLGGHIESHALHLFCLVLPDLASAESVLDLLKRGDEIARGGLALKGLGNRIQELAGGRVIHPVNVEVGGVLRLPERSKLKGLLAELDAWQKRLPRLLDVFSMTGNYPPASPALGTRIAVGNDHGFTLQGDILFLSDGRKFPADSYAEILTERPVVHSHAKRSMNGRSPFLSGALARMENARRETGKEPSPERFGGGIHGNNVAQGAELVWALDRCRELAEALLDLETTVATMTEVRAGAGIGTEIIEAPRGLLVHHYALDDMGRIALADIITPTAINQAAMEAQILADLEGVEDEEELTVRAGRIIRAFDPCISCSVHVIKVKGKRNGKAPEPRASNLGPITSDPEP